MSSDYIFVDATEPTFGMPVGMVLLKVHGPDVCAGPLAENGRPICTIHNQSAHHMRSWLQNWRSDRGIMMRVCDHAIDHPDPDDIRILSGRDRGFHIPCDGCCEPPGILEAV